LLKENIKYSDSYILDFPEESYQVILSKNDFGTVLQLIPIDNMSIPKVKHETYTFFSGLSHELRTPLNSIMGYSQLLSNDKSLTPENQTIVGHIRNSGDTLLQLINDLLDFSRINSGNYQPKISEIPSSVFFERTIRKAFEEANSSIEQFTKIDQNVPQVLIGDKNLLNRIITAIIANAIKNTQKGFVRAELNLIGKTEDKAIIKFEVSDSGNGFKDDELRVLLNESDVPLQSKILYAYKRLIRIIRFLGGRVYMDSKVQIGTNFGFVIELPYKKNVVQTANIYSEIVNYEGPIKKILIVDDDFKNRLLLTTVLSPIGFELQEAEDGIEAIKIAKSFFPDLVLIDYFMPGMNGAEAAKNIQKIDEDIKILIITGRELETGNDETSYDYILKPYDFNILFEKIKNYLNINWVYDKQEKTIPSKGSIVIYPDRDILVELYQNALIGDIRSLTAILDKLDASDSKYAAFTSRIREYAAKFKMKSIREMLRPNIEEL
jgi:CheY-like chemotaxis protein